MFVRRAFQNALTAAIKQNPDMAVHDVLLHPDLSSAVRNEAEGLMNYFRGADAPHNRPRIRTVIRWALTLENNERLPDVDSRFCLLQINRNASTVLAYPSARFYSEILLCDNFFTDEVLGFPDTSLARDPIFAGHWERLVETLIHHSGIDVLESHASALSKVLKFVVANTDILAYQLLVSRLLVDFQNVLAVIWPTDPETHFILDILNEACRRVFLVRNRIRRDDTFRNIIRHRLTATRLAGFSCGGWSERRPFARPMTWEHLIAPEPIYRPRSESPPDVDELLRRLYPEPPTRLEQLWSAKFADTVEIDADSIDVPYLLLNAIQVAYLESEAIVDFLKNKDAVERLLVCAVFCDPVSMVSTQAFRLVRIPAAEFKDEVDMFAEAFTFCNPPVPQMIAAVPVFWQHRYPGKPQVLRVSSRDVDMSGWTPLEMFNHYLLDDPAWSDALNFQIMKILVSEENRVKVLRQGNADVFNDDTMFLRFLSYKFRARRPLPLHVAYGMECKEDDVVEDADMSFASHLLEALPDDQVLVEHRQKSHIPLNGYLYEFIRFWQTSSMFRTGGDDNEMSDVAPKLSDGAAAAALKKHRFMKILEEDIELAAENEKARNRLQMTT
jgi:hypothetical protein